MNDIRQDVAEGTPPSKPLNNAALPPEELPRPESLAGGDPACKNRVELTVFRGENGRAPVECPRGQRVAWTPDELKARLGRGVSARPKHLLPGFAAATFVDDYRSLAGVEQVTALILDADSKPGALFDMARLVAAWSDIDGLIHTTASHTPAATRARVVLLLSRPVTVREHASLFRWACDWHDGIGLPAPDSAARDASRFWFIGAGPAFASFPLDGDPLDVDSVLRACAPTPPARPPLPPSRPSGDLAERRAAAWLAAAPPAISGAGGDRATWNVVLTLVRGFGLAHGRALALLRDWNQTCEPPWGERDLVRKVERAATARLPVGFKMHERGQHVG